MEEFSLHFAFEEFCKDKCLKFSKISDFVYQFPEKSFNLLKGEFFLDFSQVQPLIKVKLINSRYENLEFSQIEAFKNSPKYNKIGFFVYRLKSDTIYDLFEEIYEILNQLSEDLENYCTNPCKACLAAFSFGSTESNFVKINKRKYNEVYKVEPLMWFGDFYLIFSNNLATNELFVECLYEKKSEKILKIFYKKTQFDLKVGLKDVLKHFGIRFHKKFKITHNLYKCIFKKSKEWIDFYVEKMLDNNWIITPMELQCFTLTEANISEDFLESCRAKIQFNMFTTYSLKKSD